MGWTGREALVLPVGLSKSSPSEPWSSSTKRGRSRLQLGLGDHDDRLLMVPYGEESAYLRALVKNR